MTLAAQIGAGEVLAMRASVSHARRGALRHAFSTVADYILVAPETLLPKPLLSHNRFNLLAFHDADHGGERGRGTGASWAWQQFEMAGIVRRPGMVLALLTQPRFLGYWFNPVSFWMVIERDDLLAVIAEVNNTFGQRHSYLLGRADLAPVTADTRLTARKIFHVSPFQDVAGEYRFNFSLRPDRIAIRISHIDGDAGVDTAMTGPLAPLTVPMVLASALRRPGGALRVVSQIYWHALRLKLKGAPYRRLPAPPHEDITR